MPLSPDPNADGLDSLYATGPLRDATFEVIDRLCGDCHAHGQAQGGFSFTLDVDGLRQIGLAPNPSARSALLTQLKYGDWIPGHPDPGTVGADVETLTRFLKASPGVLTTELCGFGDPQSFDDLYAELLADLEQRDAAARPFIRYFSARTSRVCGSKMIRLQTDLFERVNELSSRATIVVPSPVADSNDVYAIDLRDYGWDRPIDANQDGEPEFGDAWEAIVAAAGAYALRLQGAEADELTRQMGTAVPFLSANTFLEATQGGSLYYALVGDPGYADLLEALDSANGNGSVSRWGSAPLAPKPDQKITRYVQTVGGRVFWVREQPTPSGSVRAQPFGAPFSGGQVIFTLPNGLLGYALLDAAGTPVAQVPTCLSTPASSCPSQFQNFVSCTNCHGGPTSMALPFPDLGQDVRTFTDQNPSNYDDATLVRVEGDYPKADVLFGLMSNDMLGYANALGAVYPLYSGPNGASALDADWHDPLTPELAAQEVGLSLDDFRTLLPKLTPGSGPTAQSTLDALRALAADGAPIDRDTFSAGYQQLLCARDGARNRPTGCP
jgi:hypothetical protein